MTWTTPWRRIVCTTSLCLAALAPAWTPALAKDMVSIRGSTVNMRAGPGTHSMVLWELDRGYPLQVLKRRGAWLQVRDYENDRGWVARRLTGHTPHHVVKSRVANVRSGPGMQHRVVGKAVQGEVLRTEQTRAKWVKVRRSSGQSGWISRPLLWGW